MAPSELSSVQPEQLYMALLLLLVKGAFLSQNQNRFINQAWVPGPGEYVAKQTLPDMIGESESCSFLEEGSSIRN